MCDYDLGIYVMVFSIMIILPLYFITSSDKQECKDCPKAFNLNDGSAQEVKGIHIGNLKDCIQKFPEGYNHYIYMANNTPYCSVTFWTSDLINETRR